MTDIESQQDYYDDIGFSERLGSANNRQSSLSICAEALPSPARCSSIAEEHPPHQCDQ